jgi:methionine-rich copper-binding protein CopC
MRPLSTRLFLCLALLFLAPALFAHDVTISGTQTFASLDGSSSDHDGAVNGVFTVNDGNLTVSGSVTCIDTGSSSNSACAMAFSVSGNMTVSSGASLYAENRTGGGTGGSITLTVGGNLSLSGTAIVSSASTSNSGGNGGAITATVSGSATIDSSAIIDSGSKNAAGGAISLTAASAAVNGSVFSGPSRTILSTKLTGQILDGTTNTAGGAITIYTTSYAAPALAISSTANVVSQGQKDGAGTVTIDGCGVTINGLVAAVSTKDSSSVVVIRSGKTLTIDGTDLASTGTRLGRVRAEALSDGSANDRVDLFARRNISVTGPGSGTNTAVSSNATSNKSAAGTIRVISLEGTTTATGRVFSASASGNNAAGGTISIASGDDVTLDSATLSATGTNAGGDISARSYSGDVFWRNGSGDVRPIGSTSGVATADQGTIVLNACGTIDTTGSSYPVNGVATSTFPETHTLVCSPTTPSLPSGTSALNVCNTTPVANDASPSTNEDTAVTITLSGTDADGDTLTYSILSGPSHGTLGSIVFVNATTSTVNYTPAANYNGTDSFTFRASDGNGGTDDGVANITIASVNDAPSFLIGPTVSVLEDAGAQTVSSWATSISAGPSDESGQTVTFTTTNTNNSLFSVQPSVASNGTLTFTPAANAYGSATITVTLHDSGGIANGGSDTSASQTSTITVNAVNDAPSFTGGGNVVVDSNGGAYSQANWATSISAGPNETGQALTFEVTANTNTALFASGPAISSSGTLTFTPAAGATGSASITIQLRDDGGTANSGVDVSSTYTFTITLDTAPTVVSTSPANGATNSATNVNIVITYSEAVNASGSAYTIKCTPSNSSRTFVLTGSGTNVHTLDPTTILPAGQTCTVTITASQITDADANDPPDNMASNYSFSFTTDANPQIVSTSPIDTSTNNATNTNLNITWSEAVTMTAVGINCTVSGSHTNVLSSSDRITWTINPDTDFTAGETCTISVTSASVTDDDTNDPPDNPGPDFSYQITIDSAPSVLSTTPSSGSTNNPQDTNIVITFSEAVTAGASAYTITCPSNRTFTLSGNGTNVHTLDPASNLTAGQTCTVTINASQISDVDSGDPPDNMAANYSFSFSIDANPQIASTSPSDTATNVATNSNVTITWTEAVTMNAVDISCAGSGSHTSFLSSSDHITWTANPDSDFAEGELCTVTVFSADVTDDDTNDPPDHPGPDISWQFTTDSAPSVVSTTPATGSTNNATDSNIVITYSEAVTASGSAYTLKCTPSNTSRSFTLSGNGTNVHTLDPTSNLTAGQTCTVTITASQVSDVDSGDPPDNLAANYSFQFSTDANPQINSTSPSDSATNVATNSDITITWNEAVTMTAVSISCASSGSHTSVLTSGDHMTWTANPDSDFTQGELCTVTVQSANVTDDDTNDPPDNPGPDISWQFTVDSAPSVVSTTPANGSTNNPQDTNIVITYNEAVTASGTAYKITCTPSSISRTFVLSGNGTSVHTLDPTSNLTAAQTCTVQITASQISDTDAGDPPDNLAANYSASFGIDANPQIVSTSPNSNTANVATSTNINITWNEAVTMTTVSISCASSGSHTSVLSSSDHVAWTVNPDSDFSAGEQCTVTVTSASVTDDDTNDPPDHPGPDISFDFTTDAAPSVTSTSPTNGSTNSASNVNIVITYSEAVNASASAYSIVCGTSNRSFTLSGSGTTTHTLDPNSNLLAGSTCTVTVIASQISDVDAGDPPDNLAANYSFSFTVDANPQITSTSPADGSTNVAVSSNISITWTEAVTMTAVSISCASSGSHTSVLSTSDNITWTANPNTDFVHNELCTVTVLSANVTDNDTNDPPDNPGPDISWQFTTAP